MEKTNQAIEKPTTIGDGFGGKLYWDKRKTQYLQYANLHPETREEIDRYNERHNEFLKPPTR